MRINVPGLPADQVFRSYPTDQGRSQLQELPRKPGRALSQILRREAGTIVGRTAVGQAYDGGVMIEAPLTDSQRSAVAQVVEGRSASKLGAKLPDEVRFAHPAHQKAMAETLLAQDTIWRRAVDGIPAGDAFWASDVARDAFESLAQQPDSARRLERLLGLLAIEPSALSGATGGTEEQWEFGPDGKPAVSFVMALSPDVLPHVPEAIVATGRALQRQRTEDMTSAEVELHKRLSAGWEIVSDEQLRRELEKPAEHGDGPGGEEGGGGNGGQGNPGGDQGGQEGQGKNPGGDQGGQEGQGKNPGGDQGGQEGQGKNPGGDQGDQGGRTGEGGPGGQGGRTGEGGPGGQGGNQGGRGENQGGQGENQGGPAGDQSGQGDKGGKGGEKGERTPPVHQPAPPPPSLDDAPRIGTGEPPQPRRPDPRRTDPSTESDRPERPGRAELDELQITTWEPSHADRADDRQKLQRRDGLPVSPEGSGGYTGVGGNVAARVTTETAADLAVERLRSMVGKSERRSLNTSRRGIDEPEFVRRRIEGEDPLPALDRPGRPQRGVRVAVSTDYSGSTLPWSGTATTFVENIADRPDMDVAVINNFNGTWLPEETRATERDALNAYYSASARRKGAAAMDAALEESDMLVYLGDDHGTDSCRQIASRGHTVISMNNDTGRYGTEPRVTVEPNAQGGVFIMVTGVRPEDPESWVTGLDMAYREIEELRKYD